MSNARQISKILAASEKAVKALSIKVKRSWDVTANAKGDLFAHHRSSDAEEKAFSAVEQAQSIENRLEDALTTAESLLDDLHLLNKQFREKMVEYGALKPSKVQDGHLYSVIQQCVGDGEQLQNCGRWFVKVGMSIWHLSGGLWSFYEVFSLRTSWETMLRWPPHRRCLCRSPRNSHRLQDAVYFGRRLDQIHMRNLQTVEGVQTGRSVQDDSFPQIRGVLQGIDHGEGVA
jgi:hypothetical protein